MSKSELIDHSPRQPLFSRATFFAIGTVLLLACVAILANWESVKDALKASCNFALPVSVCQSGTVKTLVGGYLYGALALPLALILERLIPAKPDQPLLSVGFYQDIGWWLLHGIAKLTTTAAATYLFFVFFDSYLSFLRFDIITSLPPTTQIITVILLTDFLGWFHHLVRHKVSFFWQFHKIHHSQRQMNYFCDSRMHPFDSVFARLISFIPFYSLELDLAIPVYIGWTIFSGRFTRLTHANVKTNLGPLKYILVTPQSHRIHHSSERRHQDKNFAVIFVFWDFIFGTQHKDFDEYPDTGVHDENFPIERAAGPVQICKTLFWQIVYPFKAIFKRS